jgi:GrpB-like predicted nucleotidyltransferase (UPF0157 family)
MANPIILVEYDPNWAAAYEQEKARILEATGQWVQAVAHIGSTSVPGLAAKPRLDIMVGLADMIHADHLLEPLTAIGFSYHLFEPLIPDWRLFSRGEPVACNLHIMPFEGKRWHDHKDFRDYLRAHPEKAHEYYQLKQSLAARYVTDLRAYAGAKADFVAEVLALARAGQKI